MAQQNKTWDFLGIVRENQLTEQKYITIPFALRKKYGRDITYEVSLKEVNKHDEHKRD